MTLLNRLSMMLGASIIALNACAAPIEFTLRDFEQAAARDAAPLTAWFAENKVYLKRVGDIDLDPPHAPPPAPAHAVSVPEPDHYRMLLIGAALLLLFGARRRSQSPWSEIRVGRDAG